MASVDPTCAGTFSGTPWKKLKPRIAGSASLGGRRGWACRGVRANAPMKKAPGAFFDLGCFSPAFRSVFKHYLFLVDTIELCKLLNELTKLDVSINGLQVDALD